MENKYFSRIFILIGLVVVLGAGYYYFVGPEKDLRPLPLPNTNITVTPPGQLVDIAGAAQRFTSYDQLVQFVTDGVASSGDGVYYGDVRSLAQGIPVDAPDATLSFPEEFAAFGGEVDDFSKTNIQVQGVDEADIVKTDGEYIYTISGSQVHIVKAYPAEGAELLSSIDFDQGPTSLYLNGDRLVVYGRSYDYPYFREGADEFLRLPNPYSGQTFAKVYDISDKQNPTEVRELVIEGDYTQSRMIGEYVYLITSKRMYGGDDIVPLPRILEDGEVIFDPQNTSVTFPDVYFFPIPYDSYSVTTVTALNALTNEQVTTESYVIDGAQHIYMSTENLYITYTKRMNEQEITMDVILKYFVPRLPASDQEKIRALQDTEDFILNRWEKISKIMTIFGRYMETLPKGEVDDFEKELREKAKQRYLEIEDDFERSVIHKVALNGSDIAYQTFGSVPGGVLNQFSMDERDGYFRIATTRTAAWLPFLDDSRVEPHSNIFVLDADMQRVGGLEKLAPGESIFSARFMQDRVYLVTFERIDPFFVIDLSNPTNPTVLGELKIPGFSNYLHPYNDEVVIGLGRDTQENDFGGITQGGVKISLFNVADVANPKEVAQYIVDAEGWSDSAALHDHKAFLFSRERNLLVIPLTINQYDLFLDDVVIRDEEGVSLERLVKPSDDFRGAAVFEITPTSIKLRGLIDHQDQRLDDGRGYYEATVLRSLYIEDILYTLSQRFLSMNSLDDLVQVNSIELPFEYPDIGYPEPRPFPMPVEPFIDF